MTVTKLTIEIDDGEPVVTTTAGPDRAEPRTMAADFQVAPPYTRLQQTTTGPEGHTSSHFLGGPVDRYEWNAERRQLAVEFKGGTHITFSLVADQERVRVSDD